MIVYSVPREPNFILVQNFTTNSTMIQWNSIQPNDANGILLGYKVTLTPGNRNWTFNNHETTSMSVGNLSPNTEYTVNVFGFNINGDGAVKIAKFKTKGSCHNTRIIFHRFLLFEKLNRGIFFLCIVHFCIKANLHEVLL